MSSSSQGSSPNLKSSENSDGVPATFRPRPVGKKSVVEDAIDDMLSQIVRGLSLREVVDASNVCYAYKSQSSLLWAQFGQAPLLPWDDIQGYNPYNTPEAYPPKPGRQQLEQICGLAQEQMVKPLLPLFFPAYVQQRTDPFYFHLLPFAVESTLTSLETEMAQVYDSGSGMPDLVTTTQSTAVAARSTLDGKWYRAQIDGCVQTDAVTGDRFVMVRYVDWGNKEQVPLANVKPLLARFGLVAPLAFKCRMLDTSKTASTAMTDEHAANFNKVLGEEANDMVSVAMFSLFGPPYVVTIGFHQESPTWRKGEEFNRLVVPLTKEQETWDDYMEKANSRVNDKKVLQLQREMRTANITTPPNSSDEEPDPSDPYPEFLEDREWMTDEQWKEKVLQEWRDDEEEWRANRRRQRTGPSMKNAKLLAQGRGRTTPIDWKMEGGRPNTMPTDFSRNKRLFITEYKRPFRPPAETAMDVIVTYVEDTRNVWVQSDRYMKFHKDLTDSLQLKYSDEMNAISSKAFAPGLACVVRDPDMGNRFARCEMIQFIPNSYVLVRNVDLGNRLPPIAWTNISCIKPLRLLLGFNEPPFTYHCRIRQLSERPPSRFPEDTRVLRDLMPVGSCWILFNDDITKVPPFRVRLGYRIYPDDYHTLDVVDSKTVFVEEVERRTGVRPEYVEHNWAPPLRKRKQVVRIRKWNRLGAEFAELADMTPVRPPVIDEVVVGRLPIEVLVTAIAGPQRFYFQTSAQTANARHLAKEMSQFYVLHTMSEQWEESRIRYMDKGSMRVGKPCVVFFQGDGLYHRGAIFGVHGGTVTPDGCVYNPESIRVRFTDFGDETDWAPSLNAVYPLKPQFRDHYPQQCIEGCLDGFQDMALTDDEQAFLSDVMDDWLNPGSSTWHANFWKKSVDGSVCLVRLQSDDGDNLNHLLMRELDGYRHPVRRHR